MTTRLAILGWFTVAGLAIAGGDSSAAPPSAANLPANLPMPTLGGKQFWADEYFYDQWRIQRHALTGHCRLLDEHDLRYASGTYEQCREALARIRRQRKLSPMRGKGVIVLHGLFRTRSSMSKLCDYLRQEGHYQVFNVTYPSTQLDIAGHAQSLARIVESLEGIDEINFVAHSMGNIVIRRYLADQAGQHAGQVDARLKRFVMLTPPNHGSLMAYVLADNKLGEAVGGEAIRQLGRDWPELEKNLATPTFEFGVVAGGKGDDVGYNPLLPGDDDGTVCVSGARLAGARDFVVLPVMHSAIVGDETVMQCTLRFLQKGYLVSARQRQPLELKATTEPAADREGMTSERPAQPQRQGSAIGP